MLNYSRQMGLRIHCKTFVSILIYSSKITYIKTVQDSVLILNIILYSVATISSKTTFTIFLQNIQIASLYTCKPSIYCVSQTNFFTETYQLNISNNVLVYRLQLIFLTMLYEESLL